MSSAPQADVQLANKDLVRRYHERLWRDGDLSAVGDTWAPDAVVHLTGFDDNALTAVHGDVERYWNAFSNVQTMIDDLLAEGDRVVLRWTTSGDHTGDYGEHAATGKRIVMNGIDILRIDGGHIVEAWSLWDGLSVYEQLGVLPA